MEGVSETRMEEDEGGEAISLEGVVHEAVAISIAGGQSNGEGRSGNEANQPQTTARWADAALESSADAIGDTATVPATQKDTLTGTIQWTTSQAATSTTPRSVTQDVAPTGSRSSYAQWFTPQSAATAVLQSASSAPPLADTGTTERRNGTGGNVVFGLNPVLLGRPGRAPLASDPEEESVSRKRNRLENQGMGVGFNTAGAGEALEALMKEVNALLRTCNKSMTHRESIHEASIRLSGEVAKILTKLTQKQEENCHLLQQVVQLQAGRRTDTPSAGVSYSDIAKRGVAKEIVEGRRLPISQIPPVAKLSPAEKIIIIRSDGRDGTATKQQQQQFRMKLRDAVGSNLAGEIAAVKPTRNGGFTVVTSSEEARNQVAERVVQEAVVGEGKVVLPKARTARMVCRRPPEMSTAEFLSNMYSRHNPELAKVPVGNRTACINTTRLGWIFDLSAAEAIACDAQDGRIRHSFGMEAQLEEFIPLQQCYNCCGFGHKAEACQSTRPKCRLCGQDGHSGRNCPARDDRTQWNCYNCKSHNERRGTRLGVRHAAAQMHLCPVAIREKEIRRAQLAASGVFVTSRPLGKILHSVETDGSTGAGSNRNRKPTENQAGHEGRRREGGVAGVIERARGSARVEDRSGRGVRRDEMSCNEVREHEGGGRVRWDDRVENEAENSQRWIEVGGGRRRGSRGGMRRSLKTPVSRGRGGRSGTSEDARFSTPGTTVEIRSVMDDEEFDL